MKLRIFLLMAWTLLSGLHHAAAQVSFATATNYVLPAIGGGLGGPYTPNANSVTATDVNGDGKVDLICTEYGSIGGNALSVFTNNGSGGFV